MIWELSARIFHNWLKLVMQTRRVEQQKAAWFDKDLEFENSPKYP